MPEVGKGCTPITKFHISTGRRDGRNVESEKQQKRGKGRTPTGNETKSIKVTGGATWAWRSPCPISKDKTNHNGFQEKKTNKNEKQSDQVMRGGEGDAFERDRVGRSNMNRGWENSMFGPCNKAYCCLG